MELEGIGTRLLKPPSYIREATVMFDSLDERIRHDAAIEKNTGERLFEGITIAVLSVLLFGGLYYAVQLLE